MQQASSSAEKIPATGTLSSYDEEKGEGIVTLGSMKGEAKIFYDLLNRSGYGQRIKIGARIDCGVSFQEDGQLAVVKILQYRLPKQKSG